MRILLVLILILAGCAGINQWAKDTASQDSQKRIVHVEKVGLVWEITEQPAEYPVVALFIYFFPVTGENRTFERPQVERSASSSYQTTQKKGGILWE